ncbi:glutathione S-transferase family protein [Xanthobacter dioxanivorans]|uniref:Glutathione S-transferase family protein n=1 Tax=Xanthobacter dioxanivorans TaxID=2528964 RepID=A0A974SKL9_9HYPH|nr:glutathione S-transferase family protein [Xanthobacter dioxanivorans]QRG08364.1 glutathione S-transferase family protein [Xanthobacter dioxanivorans]
MLKLYWAPNSRAFRILWLLEEAGLPYELVHVDIRGGAQDDPAYRAINPMGKVPALADGDARICEGGAICAYVAERAPQAGLAPAVGDPLRARYLQWLFFSVACMEPGFLQKMMGITLPKATAGWGSFDLVMEVVEKAVDPGPYLLGDRFSAADVMLGTDLWYGIHLLKVITPTPAVAAYVQRCTSRPAFRRAEELEAARAPA